jgi:ADP-L-glycero-D-manno-heptose 6-epimerase
MPIEIEFIVTPETLRGKYQCFTEASVEKLRAAGHSRPFTSLEDVVSDYVMSYLNLQEKA